MYENVDIPTIPGFTANGVHTGIKADGKKDIALIYSKSPALAVGAFTTNRYKAAPVEIDMERIKSGVAHAIIANSGNANAATGEAGYEDALNISKSLSDKLNIDDNHILVASTGIIGKRLPLKNILGGMDSLVSGLNSHGIPCAGEAIMTTDKFPKIKFHRAFIGNKVVSLCGIAKGAGMISPNMATMLAFFFTDADIEYYALKNLFHRAVNNSFNSISVDGCMSTNDTAIILANGLAKNKKITIYSKAYHTLRDVLTSMMVDLAKEIVKDGEGATKLIEITVDGAASVKDARQAAYAVANSNLVKTAFYGCDPNWGRIVSAIGSSGAFFPTESVEIFCEGIPIFAGGQGVDGREKELADAMASPEIAIRIKLGAGKRSFRAYASDLSHEYVDINAHYHT